MKLLQVAAVLGGAAVTVAALADPIGVRRDENAIEIEALTMTTLYTTSMFTVTKCGTGVTDCQTDGTSIVTSVVAVTTTVCPFSTVPSGVSSSVSGGLMSSTGTSESSSVGPGTPVSTWPATLVTSSATSSVSLSFTQASLTDAVPTTSKPSQQSSGYAPPPNLSSGSSGSSSLTEAVSMSPKPSVSPSPYSPSSSPSSGLLGSSSLTEAVSMSPKPSVSSGPYASPSTTPSSSSVGNTFNTATRAHPASSTSSLPWSTTIVDSTTWITSTLTQTFTSVITAPGSESSSTSTIGSAATSSKTSVHHSSSWTQPAFSVPSEYSTPSSNGSAISSGTGTPASPTSPLGTGAPSSPSGVGGRSGNAVDSPVNLGGSSFPTTSTNGTWPSPTIPTIPENSASKVIGKSSTVAIVVAFAFAFDNNWLPFMLCLHNVAAEGPNTVGDLRALYWGAPVIKAKYISLAIEIAIALFCAFIIMHWFRFMLAKSLYPPINVHRQQAVVDLVSARDDSEEELDYFCGLHQKIMGDWRRRAHASGSQ